MIVTSLPDHLRLESASVLIPDDNWFGRSVGEYQACWDDECSTARLDVEVQPVNDVPTAAADGATTPEGTAVTIDVVANDNDIEDGRPALMSVRPESLPAGGTATLTSDGRVRFQPADSFVGTERLIYEIVDRDGAVASGTVTVEVTAVDSPPRAVDDIVTTSAGATDAIDVLANDTDDEDEQLMIVAVTSPSVGEVVLTANTVTFSAPAAAAGQTSFTYTIEDGHGGRSEATVYVTIVGADPAPTAPPPPPTPHRHRRHRHRHRHRHTATATADTEGDTDTAGGAPPALPDGPARPSDHDRGRLADRHRRARQRHQRRW